MRFSVDGATYEIPVVGRHHVAAGLAAIAVAREVGVKPDAIAAGLAQFTAAPGRCEVRQLRPWTLIDDTYNANPTSAEAACRLLADWVGPDRAARAEALDAYAAVRSLAPIELSLIDVSAESAAWLGPARWVRWHFVEHRRFDDPDAARVGLDRALGRLLEWLPKGLQ